MTTPAHQVTAWAASVEHALAARAAALRSGALAWSQRGLASWYGRDHAGRRTSSGARFDPLLLTAAHSSLPLGTRVLVTSDQTGRSVVVTVNDRKRAGGRVIDLSRAAAAQIGLVGEGVGRVTLSAVPVDAAMEVAEAAPEDSHAQALNVAARLNRRLHGRRHRHHASR